MVDDLHISFTMKIPNAMYDLNQKYKGQISLIQNSRESQKQYRQPEHQQLQSSVLPELQRVINSTCLLSVRI